MEKFYLDQNEYDLTDEQAQIVDEKDREFPASVLGNIQFNNWFRKFLRENSIHPVNRRMSRYWTATDNSKNDTVKMAITLRAMRSVVAVMDPEHKLSVEYNEMANTSAWDNGSKVILPTQPVKDADDLHEAIDLMGGYTVHEACHSKHTRKVVEPFVLKGWASEAKLNMPFANLLEDERIESVEMKENPGFRSYLNKVNEYHWEPDNLKKFLPEKWDDCTPMQKLGLAIPAVRYYERTKALLDPSYHSVIDAVRSLSEEYTSLQENATFPDLKKFVQSMKSALVITEEDEQNMPQPEPGKGDPDDKEDANRLPITLPCGAKETSEDGLTEAEAREVSDLVEQEVEQLDNDNKTLWLSDGITTPSMTVYRPPVENPSLMPRADNLLQKAKAALTLRRAAPKADERMMLSGELDEDELSRLMMGDMRVFRDITEEVLPSAAVYLLVDCSGSMKMNSPGGGNRLETAQKMAFLLLSSMRNRPNVKCKVLAHTGDTDVSRPSFYSYGAGDASFYRIWEEGDDLNRLSIIRTIDHGENYDSFAVAWAGNMLEQENAEQKLLIVLSDGEPAGRGYGGSTAMKHTRQHVDRLMRRGVDVLSISIVGDLTESVQKEMYRHYIGAPIGVRGLEFYNALLRNLQRVLEKVGSR